MRLTGKVAMITGAASGIGAATAQLFVDEGAYVILTDINDQAGQALSTKLGSDKSIYYHLDVSREPDWEAVFKKISRLDVLFNNAGVIGLGAHCPPQDPEHASLETWQQLHHINLDSVFLGCRFAIQCMKKTGGSIINMSSRSGVVGVPDAAAYASSKAGIRNHTKSVALYCAEKRYGIRCNSIHPGAILTPLWDPMLARGESREAAIKAVGAGIPLGHMGEPMDVAYAALYLASDESKFMTGAEITLDGGILAGSSAAPKHTSRT